jgi:hypothetical protein
MPAFLFGRVIPHQEQIFPLILCSSGIGDDIGENCVEFSDRGSVREAAFLDVQVKCPSSPLNAERWRVTGIDSSLSLGSSCVPASDHQLIGTGLLSESGRGIYYFPVGPEDLRKCGRCVSTQFRVRPLTHAIR